MLRVALTGGIACGKTTVARILERRGVPVVDADRLAREVVAPGRPAFEEVVRRFGRGVVGPDGRIDRAILGRIVFSDPAARADLEAITHPRIAEAAAAEMERLARDGRELAVYEAALVLEAGLEAAFDVVVVVAASPEAQVERIALRNGLDEAAARARLDAQMSVEDKVAAADLVIWNEGDLEVLEARVAEVHRRLLAWRAEG